MARSLLDDDGVSNPSRNPSLTDVVERAIAAQPTRRRLLLGGLGAATLPFLGGLSACGGSDDPARRRRPQAARRCSASPPSARPPPTTSSCRPATSPAPSCPGARRSTRWRRPGSPTPPARAAEQEQQVGDNHDGMHFFGFDAAGTGPGERSDEGLLVMNHEYINPEYFYAPDSDADELAAALHAGEGAQGAGRRTASASLHVRRAADGSWAHVDQSPYNRRIHGNTPIADPGPGGRRTPLMQTAADPAASRCWAR